MNCFGAKRDAYYGGILVSVKLR